MLRSGGSGMRVIALVCWSAVYEEDAQLVEHLHHPEDEWLVRPVTLLEV
jgi:hypothetical protein